MLASLGKDGGETFDTLGNGRMAQIAIAEEERRWSWIVRAVGSNPVHAHGELGGGGDDLFLIRCRVELHHEMQSGGDPLNPQRGDVSVQ